MRILGLDIGDRRIGVAVSDPTGLLARPITIIARKGMAADVAALTKLVSSEMAQKVVAGLPLSLDGSLGPQAAKVKYLLDALAPALGVPLETWDERFSTSTARELRLAAGMKKKKRQAPDDAAAAAVILQSYLDERRGRP
jgi:putative Holliday junction resolvase